MNGLKFNAALVFAVMLQGIALVWYVSKIDTKVNILYETFEKENQTEVIENQLKMKLDLESLIVEVNKLNKIVKNLKNKNANLQKSNKQILNQHKKLLKIVKKLNKKD
jgi:hypothetical protein|tara:strand:+ start:1160 stop:1483 length:324 start_codon:yes stop_codon:yes gene_type:complete